MGQKWPAQISGERIYKMGDYEVGGKNHRTVSLQERRTVMALKIIEQWKKILPLLDYVLFHSRQLKLADEGIQCHSLRGEFFTRCGGLFCGC